MPDQSKDSLKPKGEADLRHGMASSHVPLGSLSGRLCEDTLRDHAGEVSSLRLRQLAAVILCDIGHAMLPAPLPVELCPNPYSAKKPSRHGGGAHALPCGPPEVSHFRSALA